MVRTVSPLTNINILKLIKGGTNLWRGHKFWS